MTKQEIKSRFTKFIRSCDDKRLLENFYEVLLDYESSRNHDIADDLTHEQLRRLSLSLKQAAEGKVISNKRVQADIKRWLLK